MRTVRLRGPRGLRLVADVPATRRERVRGLRGRENLEPGRAMFFRRCRSVHTIGMRHPITVACLDRWLGVRSVGVVAPHRVVLARRGVRHVLELAAGTDIRQGDRLRFEEAPAVDRTIERGQAIHIMPR